MQDEIKEIKETDAITNGKLFAWPTIGIESEFVNANRSFTISDCCLEKIYAFIGGGFGGDWRGGIAIAASFLFQSNNWNLYRWLAAGIYFSSF